MPAEVAESVSEELPILQTRPKQAGGTLGGVKGIEERMKAAGLWKGSETQKAPEKTEESQLTEKEVTKEVQKKPDIKAPNKKPINDGMTDEARKTFMENKRKVEELEPKLKANETRIKELETLVTDHEATKKEREELKARLEAREKEFESMESEIAAVRVQNTKKYKEAITWPMIRLTADKYKDAGGREQMGEIPKMCAELKIDPKVVLDAIENPNETEGNNVLSEFVSNMPAMSARKFERLVEDVRKLINNAAQIEDNAPAAWAAHQLEDRKSQESEKKKSKEVYNESLGAIEKIYQEKFPYLFDDNRAPLPQLTEAQKQAGSINLDEQPPDMKAYFASAGYVLPLMQEMMDKKDARIAELTASLERATKKPGLEKGKPRLQTSKTEEKKELVGATPGERYQNWLAGKGQ